MYRYFKFPIESNTECPPLIVTKAIEYLTNYLAEEGLFRTSGQLSRVEEIKEAWKNGSMTSFNEKNPHNVAHVLKLYFRELPEPLFVSETFARFSELAEEEDMDVKVKELIDLVQLQPNKHHKTASFLFKFLHELSKHSAQNKMTPSNIAAVFGANVLRPKNEQFGGLGASAIVKIMIERYDDIFLSFGDEIKTVSKNKYYYLLSEEGENEDGFIGGKMAEDIKAQAKEAPLNIKELEEGGRLYAFREASYSVVSRLYLFTGIGAENCTYLRNKEQVKFISKIVKDLYLLRNLSIKSPAPEFVLPDPPPFGNDLKLELPQEFLSSVVGTLTDSLEKVADGVEELANALSQVESYEDMLTIDNRLREYHNIARHLHILTYQTEAATETTVVAKRAQPKPNAENEIESPTQQKSIKAIPVLRPPGSESPPLEEEEEVLSVAEKVSIVAIAPTRKLIPSSLVRPIEYLIAQLNELKNYLSVSTISFFINRPTVLLAKQIMDMLEDFLGDQKPKTGFEVMMPKDTSISTGIKTFNKVIETLRDMQLSINQNTNLAEAQKISQMIITATEAILDHNRTIIRHLKQLQDQNIK